MKGIILAGGTGSRLYPITKVTNKHLLPVGRYPMIYHAVYKLKQCDITDIMIITGKEHMGMLLAFRSGHEFGVSFTYRVQDKAGGIAQALGLCEDFVGNDRMVVILGDNIFQMIFFRMLKSLQIKRRCESAIAICRRSRKIWRSTYSKPKNS